MQVINGFKSQLKTLYIFGIFGNFDGNYKYYSAIMLVIFYWPYLIFEVVVFIVYISDLDRVGDSYFVLSHLSTTCKFLTIIIKNKQVTRVLDQIKGDEFSPYADNHKVFIDAQIKHVQNLFKYFSWVANVTILSVLSMPLIPVNVFGTYDVQQKLNQSLEIRRTLPFDWSNDAFDITESPAYEILYLGQIQIVTFACYVCVSIDCFVSGLLHVIATQFDILNIEIQRLGDNKKRCTAVQMEMEKCIKHHVKLLNISNEMSDTFNGVYLVQCCVTSIILCITAIRINYVTTVIELFTVVSYMLCIIFELYMFCHYGNKIFIKINNAIKTVQQTGDTLPAIYHSQWYLRECKCGYKLQRKHLRTFRQGIQIMMERAKYATSLTAAKLFRLNYATFVTILKSGYSFYAVLNSSDTKCR